VGVITHPLSSVEELRGHLWSNNQYGGKARAVAKSERKRREFSEICGKKCWLLRNETANKMCGNAQLRAKTHTLS
jgi:hypothetical protein